MRPSRRFKVWLEERLQAAAPGTRLPTDGQLASRFGVSRSTVRRVLETYRDRGLVERIPGKGTFLPRPAERPDPEDAPPKSSAENIADHMLHAIHTGALRRGQVLPPVKQVVYQFRVSSTSVQQAYRMLQDKGVVTKVGRTFWIGTFMDTLVPETRKSICMLAENQAEITKIFTAFSQARAYQKMEHELLANGYALDFLTLDALPAHLRQWRKSRRLPYGFAFRCSSHTAFDPLRADWDAIRSLAARSETRSPVMLLEVIGALHGRRPPGLELLSGGNVQTATARTLARYLVDRRWHEANFFTAAAGGMTLPGLAKSRAELKHLDGDFVFRITAVAPDKPTRQRIAKKLADSMTPVPWTEQAILGKYEPVPKDVLMSEVSVLRSYGEVFDRFPNARMWVFERDGQAAKALQWATDNHVRVPDQLSIMTTDHDPDFLQIGFSCCFPDYEQIGYQMAHALIGDYPVTRTSKGFIRTRSLLVERHTTRNSR